MITLEELETYTATELNELILMIRSLQKKTVSPLTEYFNNLDFTKYETITIKILYDDYIIYCTENNITQLNYGQFTISAKDYLNTNQIEYK
jgi:hypothetical protein